MQQIYTIGHSNHPIEKFLSLLTMHHVQVLGDIRITPRSRFNPQYNGSALAKSLNAQGIGYEYFHGLGGWRKPKPDSINQGITSESFRGYADHMASDEFKININKVIEISKTKSIVVMCAEAKPSMCHRLYLADALLARGFQAFHILPAGELKPHEYTEFAVAESHEVTYPLPLFA